MSELEERGIECPYCGETISVLLDRSIPHQTYVEDCPVCCRPIVLDVVVGDDEPAIVHASTDQD